MNRVLFHMSNISLQDFWKEKKKRHMQILVRVSVQLHFCQYDERNFWFSEGNMKISINVNKLSVISYQNFCTVISNSSSIFKTTWWTVITILFTYRKTSTLGKNKHAQKFCRHNTSNIRVNFPVCSWHAQNVQPLVTAYYRTVNLVS